MAPYWKYFFRKSTDSHSTTLFAALCCLCLKWRQKEFELTENFKEGETVNLIFALGKHQTKKKSPSWE